MIKIEWRKLIYDYVWFGCYIMGFDHEPDKPYLLLQTYWDHCDSLHIILWPVRRYGKPLPTWWLILWKVPLMHGGHRGA